jgi:hypothetical protein
MTRESNLSIKAKHNYKVANYSERKRYYDVAISRYYYYLYQNIIDYISINGLEINANNNLNSHYNTIATFISSISNDYNLDEEDLQKINLLQKLRAVRNSADYKDELRNKTTYERDFKNKFTTFNNIIVKKLQLW